MNSTTESPSLLPGTQAVTIWRGCYVTPEREYLPGETVVVDDEEARRLIRLGLVAADDDEAGDGAGAGPTWPQRSGPGSELLPDPPAPDFASKPASFASQLEARDE